MPSKRDPAKQRRQAQNRAQRQAREARREAANRPPPPPPGQGAAGGGGGRRGRGGRPARRRGGMFAGKPPGYRAAFLAMLFSIGALMSVALGQPEVGDDGRALSLTELNELEEAREASDDPDEEFPEERRNGITAAGPLAVVLLLPLGVGVLGVMSGQRAADPTRAWMRCMFAMVAFTLAIAPQVPPEPSYTILYFPMVIALSVATFQSRRAQATIRADDGGVIEATATDLEADLPDETGQDGDLIEVEPTDEVIAEDQVIDVEDADPDQDGERSP